LTLDIRGRKERLSTYLGGHPFMTSTKESVFLTPPHVHMRPNETNPSPPVEVHMPSIWSRPTHHSLEMATSIQRPSRPKTEIRLWYDCNLFKTVLL